MATTSKSYDAEPLVVVVGAGIAGLYCAQKLQQEGKRVIVLEAQDYVGGRVKNQPGFVPWKDIEVGAEFIHGPNTMLKRFVDQMGFPCRLLFTWAQGDGETPEHPIWNGISFYYFGKEKKLVRYDTKEADIRKGNNIVWSLGDEHPMVDDNRTLDQWLHDHNLSERAIALLDSGYGNTVCSSLDRLSVCNMAELEYLWNKYDGHGDFRVDTGLASVVKKLAENLDIRLEWVVKSVNYEASDEIKLTNQRGETIVANRVVIAVPVTVMQDNDIQFVPALPKYKIEAINSIKMYSAMKIVLKFSRRFWPGNLHGVICADSFIPEFWFDEPNRVGALTPASVPPKPYSGDQTFLVSGFPTSKNAERIGKLSRETIIEECLKQLDDMFGNGVGHKLANNREMDEEIDWGAPASTTFVDCLIVDWSKNPYIKGGYSCCSPGSSSRTRLAYRRPVNNRMFFAGEAANPSTMSVHGALQSGGEAADSVLRSLGQNLPNRNWWESDLHSELRSKI